MMISKNWCNECKHHYKEPYEKNPKYSCSKCRIDAASDDRHIVDNPVSNLPMITCDKFEANK